jgi:FMN phosphatase YigB (HAD superfamily)
MVSGNGIKRKNKMIIGFDLDGVLCDVDTPLIRMMDNIKDDGARESIAEWYYSDRKPILNPRLFLSENDKMIIITSRPKKYNDITRRWVKHYFPHSGLIMIDQDSTKKTNDKNDIDSYLKSKVERKAKVINELGIDIYFDDDVNVLEYFRELCEKCKIIKYGGRVEIN